MRIHRGTMFLLIALAAAGILLLPTVAAAQGQGPPPPLAEQDGKMLLNSTEESQATHWAEPSSWRPASPSAATPVLVIMDSLPWSSTGIQDTLNAYGIPYDQINSSAIPTTDLSPYAMVIIPSVQGNNYYDTYNSNLAKFEAYVAAGGVLELHAATYSNTTPRPTSPGGVTNDWAGENQNYVEDPTHPLVKGVPNPLSGSYASHNYFTNIITGTTVICTRGDTPGGDPTLIEYPYGNGLVIASGQTMEYYYSSGQGAGIILQNMIPYAYSHAVGGFVALPPDPIGGGSPGAVVSHTLTLQNYTGLTDTFDLTATGATWTTTLSISSIGPISDGASADFTVLVEIPAAATEGMSDVVAITATSMLSPTVYSDTTTLRTVAVGDLAYVTLSDSNLVALVDTVSHVVIGSVDMGAAGCRFPWRATMSPAGDYAYVGCDYSGSIAVIETAGNTVTATVTGIPSADGIAFTRDGAFALVGSRWNSRITVVDTTSYVITRTIFTPGAPRSIVAHPYLDRAYATCKNGSILVIDTTSFSIIKAVPVNGEPWDVAVSPDGRWVFTGDRWGAGLDVIPAGGDAVYTTVTGLGYLTGLDVAPDGSKIYVSSLWNGVHVIDGATFNRITTIGSLGTAWETAVTCDGSELYVGNVSNQIPVIDTTTFSVTDQIIVPGNEARGIAICPQTRLPGLHLYPSAQSRHGAPGQNIVYGGYLVNGTGQTDSFDLSYSGNSWDTDLSPANTGPLADGDWITFTAQVTIPVGAAPGDVDAATIQAASVASPTVYSATGAIATTAICGPNLVFSGQSAGTTSLDDTHKYGGQKLTHIHLHAHTTSDRRSLDGTVQGYNPLSDTWQTLGTWTGVEHLLLDQYDIPPLYSAVRVQLDDSRGSQIYYDYQFTACREPAVSLNPLSQQGFAQAGTTIVYTQTVSNYMMATDSFDLSITGNSWPTTLWDGATPITNTGELADQETFTFTVKVEAPAGIRGNSDTTTIQAISVASPVISDTATLQTVVPGDLAYVTLSANDLVALVDTASHLVAGSVNVGVTGCDRPWRATMSPDGDHVYVGCYGYPGSIAVIETAGNTVVTTVVGIPEADGIAFTRDGAYALVGSRWSDQIAVVDTTTYSITRFIPTPGETRSVAAHPNLDLVYATCANGTILVVDTTSFTVTTVITTSGSDPWDVAVSPDGQWVFASDRWGAGLDVIKASNNTVYTTITGLGNLTGLEVAPDGSKVYASGLSNGVHVIDSATFSHTATVENLGTAWEAAVTCDGNELYVGNVSNQIPVIDTTTFSVTDQIIMPGNEAQGIAICPQGPSTRQIYLPLVMRNYAPGG